MVRKLLERDVDGSSGDVFYRKLAGNSSDEKPTANMGMGSVFIEVNTGKRYLFNETTGEWVESYIAQ